MHDHRRIAAGAIALLAACHQPNSAVVDENLGGIIQLVAADALHGYGALAPGKIVLLDLRSFSTYEHTLSVTSGVERCSVLPAGVIVSNRSDAVHCGGVPRNCSVRGNGLFVRLDSLRLEGSDVDAVATYSWTDRRPSGRSAVGHARTLLVLRKQGNRWFVIRRALLEIT